MSENDEKNKESKEYVVDFTKIGLEGGVGKTGYRRRTVTKEGMQARKVEREIGVPAPIFQDDAIERITDIYESSIYNSLAEELLDKSTIPEWTIDKIKKEINRINPFLKYEQNIVNIRKKNKEELYKARNTPDNVRRTLSDLYKTWIYPMKSANFLDTWQSADIIRRFAGMMVDYIANNFDYVHTNVGEEGTLKSAFSLGLAIELMRKGMDFDIVYDMFFASTPYEYIIQRIENTKNRVFIFDEAQKHFDSRNFNTREQKDLVQAIINSRARGHIIILNTPDINAIDNRFRDRRVRSIINLLDGQYGLFMYRHSVGSKQDPFMLKKFEGMLNRIHLFTGERIAEEARKLRTVYLVFRMDTYPTSKEIYDFYSKLKMAMNKVSSKIVKEMGGYNRNLVYDLIYYILRDRENSEPILKKLSKQYNNIPVDILRLNLKRIVLPYVNKMRRRAKKSQANKLKMFDDDVYVNEADMRGEFDLSDFRK